LTDKRFTKIKYVAERRQKFLTLVLENIHDRHNVSAILRSADAVGIDKIYLIYNTNKYPKMGKHSSASAKKWIDLERFDNAKDCFDQLKKQKFKIYSTFISEKKYEGEEDTSLYELDLTKKTALVFGNEHTGVSDEVKEMSHGNFMIPMYGMIQSLNVSVAVAVSLYEALRQRELKGKYSKSDYTKTELKEKIDNYINRKKYNAAGLSVKRA
jgi:tRNA (guanosine-2'-O-)-methyltransferase